ncbi:hypothetical protein C3F09_01920 [candidate division GN15 bacterium]|uniref:Uncharacterized protein n=1 Tax=candidate division GN15 bacterium TaxID=2072418 RepID=A0A855X4F3_9BACT|nr:MAG: hypothetical protein C3F09_01920 [candidate division GN15 bacterium]
MNGTARFLIIGFVLAVVFSLTQCADPLDITNQPVQPHPYPSDTTYVVDTIYVIDTVTQTHFDTTLVIDTVLHTEIDTVMIVDTVTQNHYDTTYVVDTIHHGRVDTLFIIDTVIVTNPDTVSIIDTVYQTDTLTVVDTVIVTNDTTLQMCGRIESCQKEIVWLLFNPAGNYQLSFAAYIEKDQPPQSLTVQIGESAYTWNTADSTTFTLDSWLDSRATITITSLKPPARGHAVYVCLNMTRY